MKCGMARSHFTSHSHRDSRGSRVPSTVTGESFTVATFVTSCSLAWTSTSAVGTSRSAEEIRSREPHYARLGPGREPWACGRYDVSLGSTVTSTGPPGSWFEWETKGNELSKEVSVMMLLFNLLAQYGGGGSGGGGFSPLYWVIVAIVSIAVIGGAIWLISRSRSG
jgi:hypothetical protein